MNARSAILAEIIAHPESNDLRSVFADAISSEDPEWSTHIIESMSSDWFVARRDPPEALRLRIRGSLGRFADLAGGIDRGFVYWAQMPIATFIEHGEEILGKAPIIGVSLHGPERSWTDWNELLPTVLSCPALKLVRSLSLSSGTFDEGTMRQLIRGLHSDRLLTLDVPYRASINPELEPEMWELLFESPVFRRMIDWGFGLAAEKSTHRHVGDRVRVRERPDSDYYYVTTYVPMPLEDRAIEEKYGYIPRLHAGNWDATVLDVLRGVKPDFPVGARPVPEMYAVPPPLIEKVSGMDF